MWQPRGEKDLVDSAKATYIEVEGVAPRGSGKCSRALGNLHETKEEMLLGRFDRT